jgi:DNA-binding NarL/FixJ family response regulator
MHPAERANRAWPGARPEAGLAASAGARGWSPIRVQVAELRAAGKSLGEIAAEMGLAKSTVARIVEETAAFG